MNISDILKFIKSNKYKNTENEYIIISREDEGIEISTKDKYNENVDYMTLSLIIDGDKCIIKFISNYDGISAYDIMKLIDNIAKIYSCKIISLFDFAHKIDDFNSKISLYNYFIDKPMYYEKYGFISTDKRIRNRKKIGKNSIINYGKKLLSIINDCENKKLQLTHSEYYDGWTLICKKINSDILIEIKNHARNIINYNVEFIIKKNLSSIYRPNYLYSNNIKFEIGYELSNVNDIKYRINHEWIKTCGI